MTDKQQKERLETAEANIGRLWEAITELKDEIPVGMKDSHLDLVDRQSANRETLVAIIKRIEALEGKGGK